MGLEEAKSDGCCAVVKEIGEILISTLAQIVLGDSAEDSCVRKVVEGFVDIKSEEGSIVLRRGSTKEVVIDLDEGVLRGEMRSEAEHIGGKGGVCFEVV